MRKLHQQGFTLIELVIVLGISGLIFAGLWGLMTSGSSQLQAQSAAQQYRQVIDATRKYLGNPPTAAAGGCAAFTAPGLNGKVQLTPNCLVQHGYLSANFATLSGTTYTDAFGHTINVVFEQLDASGTKFRFMAYSTGTPVINDKAGSMVSSLIGSEGGFIYSAATEGCSTTATAGVMACGSFGSFAFNTSSNSYITSPTSGHIATLSYTNDNAFLDSPWLARSATLGVDFNTMRTALYMSGSNIDMTTSAATTGGGQLQMDGGSIVVQNGKICMGAISGTTCATSSGGSLFMAGGDIENLDDVTGSSTSMAFTSLSVSTSSTTSSLSLTSGFSLSLSASNGISITPGGTNSVIVSGPSTSVLLDVTGTAKANELQAGTFIYSSTSDEKLKANKAPIQSALERISSMRGYTFDWKETGKKDIGVIAQEVKKVFPEVVTHITEDTLGVDYGKLVAPLIEAVRELKAQNDELKKEVEALKKKVGQ